MKPINVLSLFDGISCGQIALQRTGIPVANYFASEIDKNAIKVTQHNYPNTIQLGSVTALQHIDWLQSKIDLLIGGSPCQGFSFAGKQLNFEDPRSALFFEYVRILKEIQKVNPEVKFLLENVKMKKQHQDVISSFLGVEPVFIDSSNYSAHNRPRIYWTNIKNNGSLKRTVSGLKISDIISNDIHDGLYLNPEQINRGIEKNKAQKFKTGSSCGVVSFPTPLDRKVKSMTVVNILGSREVTHVQDEKGIRILSRNEKEKAQTVPLNYTSCLTENEASKALGNGWTVDVIVEFFKNLKPEFSDLNF